MYNAKMALLGAAIDYAGTYPPAKLALNDALTEAASFRSVGKHPWLMGRMALPARLSKDIDAAALFKHGADGAPWIFTAVSDLPNMDSTLAAAISDIESIHGVNEKGWGASCRYGIVAYEFKLPKKEEPPGEWKRFFQLCLDGFLPIQVYVEVPVDPAFADSLRRCVSILSECPKQLRPGLKIRTGGTAACTPEQLTEIIVQCVSHALCFKATQGLHHAISTGAETGFINLFAALHLAQTLGLKRFDQTQALHCLLAAQASEFDFGAETFRWSGHQLSCAQVESSRAVLSPCFGSCSLQEPDDSLHDLFD